MRDSGAWSPSTHSALTAFQASTLRSRSLRVLGYTNNELTADQRREALTALLGHAARGELSVDHEVVPLDRVAQAWDALRDWSALHERLVPGFEAPVNLSYSSRNRWSAGTARSRAHARDVRAHRALC